MTNDNINFTLEVDGQSDYDLVTETDEDIGVDLDTQIKVTHLMNSDYNQLQNKPSINSVTLQGNLTSEDLGIAASFPEEGYVGDILTRVTMAADGVAWVTPASSAEKDNTRPITAAAVYTEIGNINALLATI